MVNTREVEIYFARPVLRMMIQQPLVAAARAGQYDVICTVAGGGLSGQAGAVRHGISKALTYFEPDLRGVLKKGGFLTRDSPRGRAQEVRQGEGPPLVPVLEALIAAINIRCRLAANVNSRTSINMTRQSRGIADCGRSLPRSWDEVVFVAVVEENWYGITPDRSHAIRVGRDAGAAFRLCAGRLGECG